MIYQKEGLAMPDQGTAVGGKGLDGKFYFLQVNSDGTLGITSTTEMAAEATAAAPAYSEGQNAPLSQDLSGRIRTLATTQTKQYTGVPSSFAILTADATVFTLSAGEVGFIQNLSADAPLAVKKGASASTTSLNYILKACTAASDGTGGAIEIKDWVGVVSVAKMTGTASYLAWKQAP